MNSIGASLTIAAIVVGFSATRAEALVVKKPDFTLVLPDGWVEIPQEVLQAMEAELKRQAPNAQIPHYDYGFQRADGANWLAYPYVLVQINNAGRLSEYDLRKMPKFDTGKAVKDSTAELKSLFSNAKAGQLQYDEAAHVVWMTTQIENPQFGKVDGLSGMIPTEKGMLQIHGYSTADKFPAEVDIFRKIVTSAKLSPALEYQARWGDNSPLGGIDWNKVSTQGIIGGVVGALAALVAVVARKFKKAA